MPALLGWDSLGSLVLGLLAGLQPAVLSGEEAAALHARRLVSALQVSSAGSQAQPISDHAYPISAYTEHCI